jgi:hypothetical protein
MNGWQKAALLTKEYDRTHPRHPRSSLPTDGWRKAALLTEEYIKTNPRPRSSLPGQGERERRGERDDRLTKLFNDLTLHNDDRRQCRESAPGVSLSSKDQRQPAVTSASIVFTLSTGTRSTTRSITKSSGNDASSGKVLRCGGTTKKGEHCSLKGWTTLGFYYCKFHKDPKLEVSGFMFSRANTWVTFKGRSRNLSRIDEMMI